MIFEEGLSHKIQRARRQTLADLLARTAARYPDKLAIVCGDRASWTYSEFDKRCTELAAGLQHGGLREGDCVAVLARNSHSFALLRFALARCGAVLVPINFMLNEGDVAYILQHSGAKMLCVDAEFHGLGLAATRRVTQTIELLGMEAESQDPPASVLDMRALPLPATFDALASVQVVSDDVAQIVYTSGTESKPKGARLSHDAVIWEYVTCIVEASIAPGDILLHALPLYHCAQLDVFLGPAIYVGATNVITAQPTPDNISRLVARHQVTSFFAPPTIWIALLRSSPDSKASLQGLKKGYYGASIMPVEVLKELLQTYPALQLWNLYGQTEIAPVATILAPEDQIRKAGSAGRPALNVETRVVDDQGIDVPIGEVGEIVHRSPQLLLGYHNNEEKSEEAFAHGWFHSGDLGVLDSEGYLTIVDRKKDMIKSGGENISSREVEETIYRLPEVSEVAVIATPDEKWVEAVTAVIVLKAAMRLSQEQVVTFCEHHLAKFKVPKRVIFTEALPKNPSGKILKRDLREQFS